MTAATVPAMTPLHAPATTRPASGLPSHRPSLRAAYHWENRKAPNRWYWPLVGVLCALGLAVGYSQYLTYRDEFAAQGATWDVLWAQSWILLAAFFLPLTVGAATAQTASAEHRGRNWQRMAANRLVSTMLASKLLHGLQNAVLTVAVFALEFAGLGLLLGFDAAGLPAYLPRIVAVIPAVWAVEVFVMWLGVVMRSFAAMTTTVFVGAVVGMGLVLVAPPLLVANPLSLVAVASGVRAEDPGALTAPASAAGAGAVCLVWVAVLATAMCHRAGRLSS